MKFNCMEDFEKDRVYLVTKGSNDGTLHIGDHVWVASDEVDHLNCLSVGWLESDNIDEDSVFSAEFEIAEDYVCITIPGRFSQVMPKDYFEDRVIIK